MKFKGSLLARFLGALSFCVVQTIAADVYGPSTSTGTHTISWDPYPENSMTTVFHYTVTETFAGTTTEYTVNKTETSESFTRQTNGSYKYSVAVLKETCNPRTYECYASTAQLGSVTVNVTFAVPGAPGAINAPGYDADGSYTVSWGKASGTVASYVLQEQTNGGGWVTLQNNSALSRSISGKSEGRYGYRVQACNSGGCGNFNAIKTVVVLHLPGVPGAISLPASDTDGAYSVSWGAASGTVASYDLQEQVNGGSWKSIQKTSVRSRSISGKTDGRYGYRVQACNASGCGNFTATKTIFVGIVPASPSSVTVPASNTNGSYNVSWSAASHSTYYQISEKFNTTGWSDFTSVGNALSRNYTGKYNGSYRYRVRACNVSGCSNPTTSNSFTVDRTPNKKVMFIHTDQLGSPVAETDETGSAN